MSMGERIGLGDFGKLARPKTLTDVFLLNPSATPDLEDWWIENRKLSYSSTTFNKDMLAGTYGMNLDVLFSDLSIDSYHCQITSFLVLVSSEYKLLTTLEQIEFYKTRKPKAKVKAVGVTIFKNSQEVWNPNDSGLVWLFRPRCLVRLEDVKLFEEVETGDVLQFQKTNGMVMRVLKVRRKRFYLSTSWTNRSITYLTGTTGKLLQLNPDRPFKLIKLSSSQSSTPPSSSSSSSST